MDEEVLAGLVRGDEPEALVVAEPLHGTGRHVVTSTAFGAVERRGCGRQPTASCTAYPGIESRSNARKGSTRRNQVGFPRHGGPDCPGCAAGPQRNTRPHRDRNRDRGAVRRVVRRRLAVVERRAPVERPRRVHDLLRRDRARRDGRIPPPPDPPLVQVQALGARHARDLRVRRDRGPGDLVGRRPPQAPRVLRPGGRPAQPARRPRRGLSGSAARAYSMPTWAGCSSIRTAATSSATRRT